MKKHQIRGDLLHVPDTKTPNKFLLVGPQMTNEVPLPGKAVLRLRLVDETRVEPVVALLPRVEMAVAEWENENTTGMLRLKLRPAQSDTERAADAQSGGGDRMLKVKDLLRDLTKDQEIPQSRPHPPSTTPPPPPPPPPGDLEP